jgi:hypothetical protein
VYFFKYFLRGEVEMAKIWRFVVKNNEGTMSAVITIFASNLDDAEEWALDFCREGLEISPMKELNTIKSVNSSDIVSYVEESS